ncbi:MAG: hypothetical protein AAFV72_16565 [Cyanobacteria bacterium J06635_1]
MGAGFGQCDRNNASADLSVRYLVEAKTEDPELLLKQHNLIRSVSLTHLKRLTFEV